MKVMVEMDLAVLNELRRYLKNEREFGKSFLERLKEQGRDTYYFERKIETLDRIWEEVK